MTKETTIRDTIIKIIEKTVQPTLENSEIYKEIINSQNQTYNLLIYTFTGIMVLLAGVSWFANRNIIQAQIIKKTKKILQKEKMKTEVLKSLDSKLNFHEAKIARLFAIQTTNLKEYSNAFSWYIKAAEKEQAINSGEPVRRCLDHAIDVLETAKNDKDRFKRLLLEERPDTNYFFNIIDKFPSTLNKEKNQIKNLLKEFEICPEKKYAHKKISFL